MADAAAFVPAPWTPLRVDGAAIVCTNRRYGVDGPLPSTVTATGHDVVTGPITLRLDGVDLVGWDTGPIASDARHATWTADTTTRDIGVHTSVTVDYDGFWDVAVTLNGPGLRALQRLSLHVPVAPVHARFLHFIRDIPASHVANTLELDDHDGIVWSAGFQCGLWLGNDDVGLHVCMDSAEHLRAEPANTIERAGDVAALHVALLDGPVRGPVTVRFGLVATPLRPRPNAVRDWRVGPGSSANAQILWWPEWTATHAETRPKDPAALQARTRELKSRGVALLPYVAMLILSESDPAYAAGQGSKWRRLPLFSNDDEGTPYWLMCQNTPWSDHLAEEIEHLVTDCGLTGIYFDFFFPLPCDAPEHGCGFSDAAGVRQPSYNVFAFRRLAKDVYERIKQVNPDALVIVHCSDALMYSCVGFGDLMVTAEEKRTLLLANGGHYLDVLPLAEMRADHRGHHAGLGPLLLPELATAEGTLDVERAANSALTREMLALTLLHDVGVWPIYCHLDSVEATRVAQARFGTGTADFVGYWAEFFPVSTGDGGALVSGWFRDGDALLVVGNCTDELESATIESKIQSARDAETGLELAVVHGAVRVDVGPRDFRLIELSEQ